MSLGQQEAPAPQAPAKTRKKKPPKPRPDHCLNCGTPAQGKFCAECGQEIKNHSISLGPLLSEGLAELASWDSKLLRTLILLLVRPGFLTNEYNAGRLVPYLSPLKLYLTVSVLFFLLLTWTDPLKDAVISPSGLHISSSTRSFSPGHRATITHTNTNILIKGKIARRLLQIKQNKAGFVNALLNDIPKMMFLLLPLFAVSLKLLYLRTKRLYVEHLIFLLHVHAFAFIVLSPLLLLHQGWTAAAVAAVLLAYVLIALRVVYKQGWPKTLIKFSLLAFGYIFLLGLCSFGTIMAAIWLL